MTIQLDLLYSLSALRVREVSIEWEAGGILVVMRNEPSLFSVQVFATGMLIFYQYSWDEYVSTQMDNYRNMLSYRGEYKHLWNMVIGVH